MTEFFIYAHSPGLKEFSWDVTDTLEEAQAQAELAKANGYLTRISKRETIENDV